MPARSVFSRRRFLKASAAGGAWVGLSGFFSLENLFAPSADLWERWQAHDANAATSIDHGMWNGLLERYCTLDADGIVRFDYGGLNGMDMARLKAYVGTLALEPISTFNRAEQRAYWINLYNAATVKVVVDHFPVASIRDISLGGLLSSGPWNKPLFEIEGEPVTLNDIEHRILRPIWRDPRLHYALNCASIGCPNLQMSAFTADNSESLLDAGAKSYINHPRGVTVAEGGLTVSKIYAWFKDDFGGDDAGVLAHLGTYADDALKEQIAATPKIADYAYDWALNGKV